MWKLLCVRLTLPVNVSVLTFDGNDLNVKIMCILDKWSSSVLYHLPVPSRLRCMTSALFNFVFLLLALLVLELFQRQHWGNTWETGWIEYGLSRAHIYHLELNWNELNYLSWRTWMCWLHWSLPCQCNVHFCKISLCPLLILVLASALLVCTIFAFHFFFVITNITKETHISTNTKNSTFKSGRKC